MNNDLISRSELKEAINKIIDEEIEIDEKWARGLKYSLKIINNVPTVEPDKIQALMSDYLVYRCEPKRPQGEWVKWNFKTFGAMGDWEYKCSNCEKVYGGEYNFCPNCGAQMKEGAE